MLEILTINQEFTKLRLIPVLKQISQLHGMASTPWTLIVHGDDVHGVDEL